MSNENNNNNENSEQQTQNKNWWKKLLGIILTYGFLFFILFLFFYNKNTQKFQINKNEYASVSIGPKRNLKSFPYVAQLNNGDALLFCGYFYDNGSVTNEYLSELYDNKQDMFVKLPKTSKHDTITNFVQKDNFLYIYGDYPVEIYNINDRKFEMLKEKSYNGRNTKSFKYKEKTVITNNGSLYLYDNLKHTEFKLKNSNIIRYNPYILFLSDSQILIVGGCDKDNKEILQTEIYDLKKNQYQKAAILMLSNERINNINQSLLEIYTDKHIYTYDKDKKLFNKKEKLVEYFDNEELILDDKYSLLYAKCPQKDKCSHSAKILDKQNDKIIEIPDLLFYPIAKNDNVIKVDNKKFLIPVNYDNYFFEPRLETQIVEIY